MDKDVDLPPQFFAGIGYCGLDTAETPALSVHGVQRGVVAAHLYRVGRLGAVPEPEMLPAEDGVAELERFFLVVECTPAPGPVSRWLDLAAVLGKLEWVAAACAAFALTPVGNDVRGAVLAWLEVDSSAELRDEVAQHLATRAPHEEQLLNRNDSNVIQLSHLQTRVVSLRTSGFVTAAHSGSKFLEQKFPEEMGGQYELALVLTLWLRGQVAEVLHGVQSNWTMARREAPWHRRSGHLRDRFDQLGPLRRQHALVVASGTLGPVFESRSQAEFWSHLGRAHDIDHRAREVEGALAALGQSIDTEASLNLERLLAFFTLVIGVPSLIFAVLGVNISRVTSDSGLSWVSVAFVLVACIAIGVAAFVLALGLRWGRRGRLPTR